MGNAHDLINEAQLPFCDAGTAFLSLVAADVRVAFLIVRMGRQVGTEAQGRGEAGRTSDEEGSIRLKGMMKPCG